MIYLSIDLETGGLDPLNNDILEVGGVLASTDSSPKECEHFRLGVLPRSELSYYRLHPKAAAMNAELLDQLENNKSAFDAIREPNLIGEWIGAWLQHHGWKPDPKDVSRPHVVLGGKNVWGFDVPFLRQAGVEKYIKFKHRALDPAILCTVHEDEVPPDLKTCALRVGINMAEYKLHTAVDDAMLVAEVIYRGMKGR